MASCPITSWEIDGETVETVSDFIFLGSKITTDGDCSHEIKRRLLLGRKVMTTLDSILKSRDITLPTKVCLVYMSVCTLSHFSHVQHLATPWNCSLPGSSVHGILQARILELVAMPSSRGSSQFRDQTCISCVSCTGRWFFPTHTTWEALLSGLYPLHAK